MLQVERAEAQRSLEFWFCSSRQEREVQRRLHVLCGGPAQVRALGQPCLEMNRGESNHETPSPRFTECSSGREARGVSACADQAAACQDDSVEKATERASWGTSGAQADVCQLPTASTLRDGTGGLGCFSEAPTAASAACHVPDRARSSSNLARCCELFTSSERRHRITTLSILLRALPRPVPSLQLPIEHRRAPAPPSIRCPAVRECLFDPLLLSSTWAATCSAPHHSD